MAQSRCVDPLDLLGLKSMRSMEGQGPSRPLCRRAADEPAEPGGRAAPGGVQRHRGGVLRGVAGGRRNGGLRAAAAHRRRHWRGICAAVGCRPG